MAKKYKRNVSQGGSKKTAASSETSAPAVERATPSGSVYNRRAPEFNPDYTYVIKDLKRIGTLAGSFFIILVVLSFFLK